MRIWLTAFADFVGKSGTSKVRVVQDTKRRVSQPFVQGSDFYRSMREACTAASIDDVRSLTEDVTDHASDKRRGHYAKVGSAFSSWVEGLSSYDRLAPVHGHWTRGELTVSVTPELHVNANDREYVIKLHFSTTPLTKSNSNILTSVMRQALGSQVSPECTMAVLDVRRHTLHLERPEMLSRYTVLLNAEAAAFASMWDSIPPGAVANVAWLSPGAPAYSRFGAHAQGQKTASCSLRARGPLSPVDSRS